MPPFSLNPTDRRSVEFMGELFSELLPHFSSEKFNVGCDETWDVGRGRSAGAVEEKGGRVYLDYLLGIYDLVERHDRTMHFWGDIIIQHPKLVPELPKDAVVLEWGYEADHPFDEHGAEFARSGMPFFVCPGTSSWNTIAGTHFQLPRQRPQRDRERPQARSQRGAQHRLGRQRPHTVPAGELPRVRAGRRCPGATRRTGTKILSQPSTSMLSTTRRASWVG